MSVFFYLLLQVFLELVNIFRKLIIDYKILGFVKEAFEVIDSLLLRFHRAEINLFTWHEIVNYR